MERSRGTKTTTRPWFLFSAAVAAALAAGATRVDFETAPVLLRAGAVIAGFGAVLFLSLLPGLALLCLIDRRRPLGQATGLGVLFSGVGVAGMAAFWAWFSNPVVGGTVSVVILAASAVAVERLRGWERIRRLELELPLLLAFAVGLFFTAIAFIQGGFGANATHYVAVRYWVTPDNKIPLLMAERIFHDLPLNGFLVGDWHGSDRPPLQTGLALLLDPLFGNHEVGYQLLATSLQMAWLPALWTLLRSLGVSVKRILIVVLLTSMTGVIFFNVVYVTPKMLAGGLALTALAIAVSWSRGGHSSLLLPLLAALFTLSMLAHGGIAFSLIALVPFVWRILRASSRYAFAAAAGVVGLLYLPWMAYQRFVDPPGDRLLKWQLAGFTHIDKRSFLQTLVDQYSSLSLHQFLLNKGGNVLTLIANPIVWRSDTTENGWHGSFLGMARVAQMNDLLIAAGPLALGLLALALPATRQRILARGAMLKFVAWSTIAWVLILWGETSSPVTTRIAQGPAALFVAFVALTILCTMAFPRAVQIPILAASVAFFVACWVSPVGFRPAQPGAPEIPQRLDWAMLWVSLFAVGFVAVATLPRLRSALATETVATVRLLSGANRRAAGASSDLFAGSRVRLDHVAFGVLLVVGAVLYYWRGRGLSFFFDEWNFILDRRGNSATAFLQPHNGHLVVIPVLIYKALWSTVGLGHYGPYRLVDLGLHLICVVLLFVFVRRRVGDTVAVIAATSLLFLGRAWQDLLWPFQMGYLGSIAAGLGALLALERHDRRGDVAAALLLGLSLACSGLGLPFLAGAAIYLLLDRASWPRLWLIAVPSLPYAAWYLHYGQNQASASNITALPSYVFDSLAGALGALSGLGTPVGKALALLALVGVGIAVVVRRPLRAALPYAAIALLFWALTALSRAQLHEPDASRYLYPGVLVLLLVGAELARGVRVPLPVVGALGLAVVISSALNLHVLRTQADNLRTIDGTVAAELAVVQLEKGIVPPNFRPDGDFAPQISAGPYLAAVRELGSPAMPLSAIAAQSPPIQVGADRTFASAIMPLLVSHTPNLATGTAIRIEGFGGGKLVRRNACLVFQPHSGGPPASFDLPIPRAGLSVRSTGKVDIRLRRFAPDYPQSPSATLSPGRSQLRPPLDAVRRQWHIRFAPVAVTTVCTVK